MKKHFSIGPYLAAFSLLMLAGCGQVDLSKLQGSKKHTGPAWTAEQWPKLLADVKAKLGDNPRLLEVEAERHFATFQAQDPKKPENVDAWQFREGRLEGPIPVRLIGDGELEPSLFSWNEVALEKIPELCKIALERLNLEAGEVVSISVGREFDDTLAMRLRSRQSLAETNRRFGNAEQLAADREEIAKLEQQLRDNGQVQITIRVHGSRKMGDITANAKGEVIDTSTF